MSANSMPLNPATNERMIAGTMVRRATLAVALLAGIVLVPKADAGEPKPAQDLAARAAAHANPLCDEWDVLVSVREHACATVASKIWETDDEYPVADRPGQRPDPASPAGRTGAARLEAAR
jgi:hypothetical protein